MARTDPHDPREFNTYAQIDDQGNLLALVEMHAPVLNPYPETHIDVTDIVEQRYTPDDLTAAIRARRRVRPARPEPDHG